LDHSMRSANSFFTNFLFQKFFYLLLLFERIL
jgi:hypothetical protein